MFRRGFSKFHPSRGFAGIAPSIPKTRSEKKPTPRNNVIKNAFRVSRRGIKLKHQILWCSAIILAGSLACLFPLFLGNSLHIQWGQNGDQSAIIISTALHSTSFIMAAQSSLIVSIPMLVEVLISLLAALSIYFSPRRRITPVPVAITTDNDNNDKPPADLVIGNNWALVHRTVIVISLVIPTSIFLAMFASSPVSGTATVGWYSSLSGAAQLKIYWCLTSLQSILIVGSALALVSQQELTALSSGWKCLACTICFTCSQVFRLFAALGNTGAGGSGSSSDGNGVGGANSTLTILYQIFIVMFFVFCTQLMLYWIGRTVIRPYRSRRSFADLQMTDICALFYIFAVIFFAFGTFGVHVQIAGFSGNWVLDSTPRAASGIIYVQIAYTFIVTVIPYYIEHCELVKVKIQLDSNKTFLQYISHEIRTPLNTVTMGLRCLQDDLKEMQPMLPPSLGEVFDCLSAARETVVEMDNSCQVALSILNELLMTDKMESGKLSLDLEQQQPISFVLDAVKPFFVQARAKNIAMSIDCVGQSDSGRRHFAVAAQSDMDRYSIFIDKIKLAQVIRNLVSNALKFTPVDGKVRVVIKHVPYRPPIETVAGGGGGGRQGGSWKRGGGGGGGGSSKNTKNKNGSGLRSDFKAASKLRIEVVDTGVGITPENQELLFRKYTQFDAAKLQKGGGTGLGLWISKGIVEMHGGRIGAHSDGEGKGCMFFVELPVLGQDVLSEVAKRSSADNKRGFQAQSSSNKPKGGGGGGVWLNRSSKHDQSRPISAFMRDPQGGGEDDDPSFRDAARQMFDGDSLQIGSVLQQQTTTPGGVVAPRQHNRLGPGGLFSLGSSQFGSHDEHHAAANGNFIGNMQQQMDNSLSPKRGGPSTPRQLNGFMKRTTSADWMLKMIMGQPRSISSGDEKLGSMRQQGGGQVGGSGHSNLSAKSGGQSAGQQQSGGSGSGGSSQPAAPNNFPSPDRHAGALRQLALGLPTTRSPAAASGLNSGIPSAPLSAVPSAPLSGIHSNLTSGGRYSGHGGGSGMNKSASGGSSGSFTKRAPSPGMRLQLLTNRAAALLPDEDYSIMSYDPSLANLQRHSNVSSAAKFNRPRSTTTGGSFLAAGDRSSAAGVNGSSYSYGAPYYDAPDSWVNASMSGNISGDRGDADVILSSMLSRSSRAPSASMMQQQSRATSARNVNQKQGAAGSAAAASSSSRGGGEEQQQQQQRVQDQDIIVDPLKPSSIEAVGRGDSWGFTHSGRGGTGVIGGEISSSLPLSLQRQFRGLPGRMGSGGVGRSGITLLSDISEASSRDSMTGNPTPQSAQGSVRVGVISKGPSFKTGAGSGSSSGLRRLLTGEVLRVGSGRLGSVDIVDHDGSGWGGGGGYPMVDSGAVGERDVVSSDGGHSNDPSGYLLENSQSVSTVGELRKTMSRDESTSIIAAATAAAAAATAAAGGGGGVFATAAADTAADTNGIGSKSNRPMILIVDDSTANRKMTRKLLRHVARDILEAGDGRECLTVYQEALRLGTVVDIILMDDHMPNLSGPETARILRFQGYNGLICGVTGNTLPSDIKNFKDHGASCVLSKPLNIDLLKYYISQYKIGVPPDA